MSLRCTAIHERMLISSSIASSFADGLRPGPGIRIRRTKPPHKSKVQSSNVQSFFKTKYTDLAICTLKNRMGNGAPINHRTNGVFSSKSSTNSDISPTAFHGENAISSLFAKIIQS